MKVSNFTPRYAQEHMTCDDCKQLPASTILEVPQAVHSSTRLTFLCTICAEELRDKLIKQLERK